MEKSLESSPREPEYSFEHNRNKKPHIFILSYLQMQILQNGKFLATYNFIGLGEIHLTMHDAQTDRSAKLLVERLSTATL